MKSTARAHPRSSLKMLRVVALALMLVVSRGGDGGDTGDCNTGDCNTGDCNTGDCNTGHTGDCNTGHTGDCNTGECNSHHTGDICRNDTNCTQNDTACTDHACGSDGPQVNPDFGLYNCGPCDSSCNQYGGFMYNDPLWSSDIYAFGGGSYTAPAQPASSRGGYSSQGQTRPDWETKEWICQAVVDGRVCGHVNSPVYNPTECGDCEAVRPEREQPAAAPAPANVDPLTIESLPAPENDPDRKNTCCICMANVSDIVLLGAKQGTTYTCRHKCMCRQCALKMREGPASRRKCPMCRTKVDHFAVAANLPRHMENTIFN